MRDSTDQAIIKRAETTLDVWGERVYPGGRGIGRMKCGGHSVTKGQTLYNRRTSSLEREVN